MTKEEKIRRFEEMNKEVVPGQIVCEEGREPY